MWQAQQIIPPPGIATYCTKEKEAKPDQVSEDSTSTSVPGNNGECIPHPSPP